MHMPHLSQWRVNSHQTDDTGIEMQAPYLSYGQNHHHRLPKIARGRTGSETEVQGEMDFSCHVLPDYFNCYFLGHMCLIFLSFSSM